MKFLTTNGRGILLCLIIAIPAWILGTLFPIIGGPVIAILLGMLLAIPLKEKGSMAPGIQFTSKKILQWAVILLGFGLDLTVVLKTGQQSLPIILCTITVSLLIAFLLYKVLPIPAKSATLIGVGSSICGGSAIAATAPVINADDEEVAQSISVIFFFNVLAAIIFPILGNFPFFILYFILASLITTIAVSLGVDASVFSPIKTLSKFFIVLAMAAIGLNTDIVKLVKTGGAPLALGACCWIGITVTSLLMQHVLGLW